MKLICTNKCVKFGLLRQPDSELNVGTRKEADALVKTGNWRLVEAPEPEVDAEAEAKAKAEAEAEAKAKAEAEAKKGKSKKDPAPDPFEK